MKLTVLFLLVPIVIAVPGLSSVKIWVASFQQPFMDLIDNPFRQSKIPQFILDARHPWILANRRQLERLPNAESFLCFKVGSELPEEDTHSYEELKTPLDIYHTLEINNNRAGVSRPGWPNALERLHEMKRCPRALEEVKTLSVDIFVHEGKFTDKIMRALEPSGPPKPLFSIFGDVLESMTNLERLNWYIPKEHTDVFGEAFRSRNLVLPSIKHLEPGPSSQYLVNMCPNLETLVNGGDFMWYHGSMPDGRDWGLMLIQAAQSTPYLKRFAMKGGHGGWTPSLISEVVRVMPQIKSLGLLGSLGNHMRYGDNGRDGGKLQVALEILTGLENLTHLDLPDSSSIGLGFDGGPECGNAYFGKQGRIYQREVTRESAETTEEGGRIVVDILPHLSSFRIGGYGPKLTRSEDGVVNATWPWTGRMDEWLMEELPDRVNDDLW